MSATYPKATAQTVRYWSAYAESSRHRMMKSSTIKLVASVLLVVLSVLGLRFLGFDAFFVTFILGFILSLLYSMDLGQLVRDSETPGLIRRTIGLALGIPQAILGLTCIIIGGAIICWVVYNTLVERLPQYSGGFLTFGFGPSLVVFGAGWLFYAFRRRPAAAEIEDSETEGL